MTARATAVRAAVAVVAAELGTATLIRWLRRAFPWLIGPSDTAPDIAPDLVRAHAARSFDAELGWCRRPGESGTEQTTRGETSYTIDRRGRRHNPGFDGHHAPVACFGDSFTFCRLVDDDQTWPHHLSGELGVNAANYGVGNYGLDQALLRLQRELPGLDADVVVMGVVPETIARVHSVWKHYFEYGNVLAFKPRFSLSPAGLVLHPSPIQDPTDYADYRRHLSGIHALDPFYRAKFRPDLLSFPHLPKLLRRARRHGPLLGHLALGALTGDHARARSAAFRAVLRHNAAWTARLYADADARALLRAVVARFAAICRDGGAQPVLLVIPQLADLERDGGTVSEGFFAALGDVLPVVDMTPRFRAAHDRDGLYSHGKLGPHVSDRGNRLVADAVAAAVAPLLGVPKSAANPHQ